MSRKFNYEINIIFNEKKNPTKILDRDVPYPLSKSYTDHFYIDSNKIKITALRSRAIKIDSIFSNYSSAIFNQISKALAFYYCGVAEPHKIKSIEVTLKQNLSVIENRKLTSSELEQIVSNTSDLSCLSKLDILKISTLLEDSSLGHAILIAVSYLIKSCTYKNPFERFENLWKCFNALYKQKTMLHRDAECLIALKDDIKNNPTHYPLSLGIINNMDFEELRNTLRWRKMILNDFPQEKNTREFAGFISRLNDHRLMQLFQDLLPIRIEYLKNQNLEVQVKNHLANGLVKNIKSNEDLLGVLCLRYMYFVRNKSFHAEKLDHSFNLVSDNKEGKEIKWCSNLLNLLVIDVLNNIV